MHPEKPLVLIVTGPPCSGKTPLGMALAEHMRLPFINKDGFKERLFDSLGWSDREWSKKVGEASYRMMFYVLESQLAAGQGCIVESNFRPDDAAEFKRLFARYPCQVLQVLCTASPEVLLERFQQRLSTRHPGHVDHLYQAEFAEVVKRKPAPLDVGGELAVVDTSLPDSTDLEELIRKIGQE